MCEAPPEQHVNWFAHWLEEVGRNTVNLYHQGVNLCEFFGEILFVFVEACVEPRRFRMSAVVRQMYEVWIRALVIVGVLCFLIGVVIAYQGVQQLRQFGAETFTVEAVGIGMFRELGVLLTAIIVAGRSGSAFTAQIGTMQVNQEVDAMRTIGLNPVEWLVLPRIMALVISMPLLAFWGDMTGLLGGAVACTFYLDFTFVQFFERLRDTVGPWHFYTGMIKAPVFGAVIATIGCFEGLQVHGSAESVGQLTTRSVVESIFCVIVLDAHLLDHLPAGERLMAEDGKPDSAKPGATKPKAQSRKADSWSTTATAATSCSSCAACARSSATTSSTTTSISTYFAARLLGLVGGSGTRQIRAVAHHHRPQRRDQGHHRNPGQGHQQAARQGRTRHTGRTGVQFQDGALFSSLSVSENIIVPIREHAGLDEQTMRDIAALKVALVGLPPDTGDKKPSELSGGMRKRASLARALALDPELLFLDEPTAGLDPIGAAHYDELVKGLNQSLGLTILMVTHDLDSLYAVCDRIAVLLDKHVVVGTMEELLEYDHPWVREYFHGPRGRAAARQE